VGGDRIRISVHDRVVIDESLARAEKVWANAIGRYFEPARAVA
jgi:hypothetical protein